MCEGLVPPGSYYLCSKKDIKKVARGWQRPNEGCHLQSGIPYFVGPGGQVNSSEAAERSRLKREPMHIAPARPGLIVVDDSLSVFACNGEALQILTFPDQPEKIRQVDTWLTNKIRSNLLAKKVSTGFLSEFRSAKRKYLCRSFPLDSGGIYANGSGPPKGLMIVILERQSNEAVTITEISERFGLTAREQETVQFLLEGLTSKEIAQRMKISPNTVKAFIRLVMVKMNVSTRSGIIGRVIGKV